ncbi:MAG: 50S ribosomal protein L30 [Candidatus Melainabacteria bacterium]|nr:50S ribosomal protein L30 [Candidatus Melainabacteria bacterium]
MAEATKKKLSIKLVRGYVKASKHQRKVLESLGLRKSKQTVQHDDGPTILGMINKVSHLVEVKEN